MAAAPLIGVAFSAAGQVAGMVSAGNQQRASRAQADAQVRHAQRVHALEVERYNYAYSAAEQQYLQEAVVIQEQSRQAREALEQARIQQQMTVMQQDAERSEVNAQMQSQVRQMLGAAVASRTEASGANAQDLFQLVSRLGEVRGGNDELVQRLSQAMQPSSVQNNALDTMALADYQNVTNQTGTRQRSVDMQGGALERSAGINNDYAQLVDEYLKTVNTLQNQMTDYTLNIQPSLLDVQDKRNMAALSAARFANQAESNMGRAASGMNLENQMTTARLMSNQGSGQVIGGILGTLGQVVPQVVSGWGSVFGARQPQSSFGTTPAAFNPGYGGGVQPLNSNFSFGGNAGNRVAPGAPLNQNRNPYSGFVPRGNA
jgi:hypothetical protein